jgi:rhodanese-related sulfurtransferase
MTTVEKWNQPVAELQRMAGWLSLRWTVALLVVLAWGAGLAGESEGEASPNHLKVVHVDPVKAADWLSKSNLIVLDIRTPAEFAKGHLVGATNIDFLARGFSNQLSRLERDRVYLVHCASGRRSRESLKTFESLGFESIIHLEGGMKAWEAAKQPVEIQ